MVEASWQKMIGNQCLKNYRISDPFCTIGYLRHKHLDLVLCVCQLEYKVRIALASELNFLVVSIYLLLSETRLAESVYKSGFFSDENVIHCVSKQDALELASAEMYERFLITEECVSVLKNCPRIDYLHYSHLRPQSRS